MLASGLASPLQLQDRRPDRLQLADSRHRRRRRHHQLNRHYRSQHQRQPQPPEITPSPTIKKPTTPPPSPEPPPSKKPRTKSPAMNTAPTQYFHVNIEEEYLLHEKYELQDVTSTKYKAIAKIVRLPRDNEEFNVDLPAYFVYHQNNKHWTLIKGPTSKFHNVG